MYKYQILFLLFATLLFRLVVSKNGFGKLILSFFIITIPFEFTWPVMEVKYNSSAGTLGPILNITIPILLFFVLLIVHKFIIKIETSKWLIAIVVLFFISVFNPLNTARFSTVVFGIYLLTHYLFLSYISQTLTREELIEGLFDGLSILCALQIILAICFPVLEIKQATLLFHDSAADWATRMETRVGAVGTFPHPGNLALFITIASAFFLSCYLNEYKKNISLIILLLNTITLILTYSRTSYLAYVVDVFIVFFISKNAHRNLISPGKILKYFLPLIGLLIYIVYYSPLSDTFLKSDAGEMFEARLIHWYMGVETFSSSPFFGVGINTHIEYMYQHMNLFGGMSINEFFWENPIHNIHLIVLTETGLLGFLIWIIFIVQSISKSKKHIAISNSSILSSTQIGLIIGISIYGLTGWAPFSAGILPFILMFTFFAMRTIAFYQNEAIVLTENP